jgi:hypothetical protein
MSSSNVIVPPEFGKLISEREKAWADFDRSQSLAGALNQMAKEIPDCAPAEMQLQFGADSIPPAELEALLPLVKQKIETANRLKADVKSCYDEIETIKQKQKNVIIGLGVGGAVLLLILLIVLVSVIYQVSS